ncbi:MAG: hypothetical protein ABI870_12885 [Rhodanobacter sp.]
MRTVIFSGIIGEIGESGRYKGGLSFTLGEPPVAFYSPGNAGGALFSPGDHVAIAARRTFVPGAQYVALAYKNWGTKGSAQSIGTTWPSLCLGIGAIGAYIIYQGALKDPMGREVFLPMLAVGIFGVFRLVTILRATRILDRTSMPSTMRLSRL